MRLKERMQGFAIGMVCSLALMATIPVVAATLKQTIEVSYNDIKLFVDGNLIIPKDGQGNVIEPFIFNGTTYLPVRAVGEALNKNVDWDGSAQSVFIGAKPEEKSSVAYLGEEIKAYSQSSHYFEYPKKGTFKMAGIEYNKGIGVLIGYSPNQHGLYNLNAQYTQLSGVYGLADENADQNAIVEIKFYGDNKLVKILNVKYGDMPKEFSVDVQDITQLKIEIDSTNRSAFSMQLVALANVLLK